MSNQEAYEGNLEQRLAELRGGDLAYEIASRAVLEMLVFPPGAEVIDRPTRVLDVGCGLGFMATKLAFFSNLEVVGIDSSTEAIRRAEREHLPRSPENLKFYPLGVEQFAAEMDQLGEEPFDIAVLNMVLHALDDQGAQQIIQATYNCLWDFSKVGLIVPDQLWLHGKLLEYTQDSRVADDTEAWIADQLTRGAVELPVKIAGGQYYPRPLTIYNREPAAYGPMLAEAGFGVTLQWSGGAQQLDFWELGDYTSSLEMARHHRHALVSFKQEDG